MVRAHQYLLLLSALLFAPFAIAAPNAYAQGLLWKIERTGQAPSHVFGTIHSEDSRVLALPGLVQTTFDASSSYVMEVVLDANAVQAIFGAMMYGDGRTLTQTVNAATYQKTLSAMAGYGLPESALQMMKPWAVSMMLSMPKTKTGIALDIHLMQLAAAQTKAIAGLETVEEQIGLFDKLSPREQVIMLEDTLKYLPEMENIFARMHTIYLARDLAGMMRISDELMAKGNLELGKKMMKQLIDLRNRRMVERMETHLKQGNAFIAIGALHLPGEIGVLNLLARKGYRVSMVY